MAVSPRQVLELIAKLKAEDAKKKVVDRFSDAKRSPRPRRAKPAASKPWGR